MPKNLHTDQPQCPYRIMLHMSLSRIDSAKTPCNLLGNKQFLRRKQNRTNSNVALIHFLLSKNPTRRAGSDGIYL